MSLLTTLRRGGGWWTGAANAGTIDAGGLLPATLWSDDNNVFTGIAGYRTAMNISGEYAIRQTGTIKQIDVRWRNVYSVDGTQRVRFHVMRPLGAGSYRTISSSDWIDHTGSNQADTTVQYTGLSLSVRVGDFIAMTINASLGGNFKLWCATIADTAGSVYKDEDMSGDENAWQTFSANLNFMFRAYTDPPMIACIGDSIIRGSYSWDNHNTAAGYDVVTYDLTNDPAYQIASQLNDIDYQNGGIGSSTWLSQVNNYAQPMIDTLPLVLVMAGGVNDILTEGATWATTLARMDSVKALVDASPTPAHFAVAEILPASVADDTEAATIRTFNTNYAAWCVTNGATLLRCHDAMGLIRVSTGELDDLQVAYDHDGVHLTAAGIAAHAEAMSADLKAISL